jgi:molybdate transport system ATP-binding protein
MTLSVALRHAFPGFALDVRFDAPAGLTVLSGASGSGKSTVVNAVAGLLRPDSGRIAVDDLLLSDSAAGHFLPPHRRRIGYVFQEGRLFPHLTVQQNLTFGQWFAPRSVPRESLDRVVDMLGIGPLLQRRPAALSGGEKQRVAIGRALLCAPRLILADEPLAALDDARKAEILPYFERLRDEARVPILYVTHAASEVARLATTVVALRQGRVAAAGPAAQILGDPGASQSMGVRQAGSFLTGRIAVQHDDGLTELETAGGALFLPRIPGAPGSRMRVRIAARDVILSRSRPEGLSALTILRGTVAEVRTGSGPGALVALRMGDDTLLARITARSAMVLALHPGDTCHAIVKSVAIAPQDVGAPAP